jgi:hypothetical protein
LVKVGGGTVLGDHKVRPSVAVVIGHGRAALFAIYFKAGFLTGHGSEAALAIAAQQ